MKIVRLKKTINKRTLSYFSARWGTLHEDLCTFYCCRGLVLNLS